MQKIEKHTRVNDILLGPLERPALRWLAEHMPPWMTPDILTGIGALGAVVIFFGYWFTRYDPIFLWLASFGFVVQWFGDSLDGTLARTRNIQRPQYGFFVDHTMDAFSEVLVFLGLGLSPFVRLDIAMLALIGYLLVSVLVYVKTCVSGEFVISYGKLGPTEARVLAILANTLVFFAGNPQVQVGFTRLTVYDWIMLGISGLLFVIFLSSTLRQAYLLDKSDRAALAGKTLPPKGK